MFIEGKKISLKALSRQDITDDYLEWVNDIEINRYLEVGVFPTNKEKLENYYNEIEKLSNAVVFAIIDNETKKHVGNVKIDSINWIHRRGIFGIMIGDKESSGKGIGFEATKLAVEYAFYKLNLRKISLGVIEENQYAIKIYEKLGFQKMGLQKEEFFYNGRYLDALYMELLKCDYEEIKN